MKIEYNVPSDLEDKFKNKSQSEIDHIISKALYTNSLNLIQDMCFDILSRVSELQTFTKEGRVVLPSYKEEIKEIKEVKQEKEKKEIQVSNTVKKLSKSKKSKLAKKFMGGILK